MEFSPRKIEIAFDRTLKVSLYRRLELFLCLAPSSVKLPTSDSSFFSLPEFIIYLFYSMTSLNSEFPSIHHRPKTDFRKKDRAIVRHVSFVSIIFQIIGLCCCYSVSEKLFLIFLQFSSGLRQEELCYSSYPFMSRNRNLLSTFFHLGFHAFGPLSCHAC